MKRIPTMKALKWAGYPLFFLFCFVLFAYKTFPYERLANRIIQEGEARGYQIEIVDLTNAGMSGLQFEGLSVIFPPKNNDARDVVLLVDELTVRASVLSLVSKSRSYRINAELGGGIVEGDFSVGQNGMQIEAEIEQVNLGTLPALRQFTQIPVAGVLDAKIELQVPQEVNHASGDIKATIQQLSFGDGKSKLMVPNWGGLTLDRADAGNLEFLSTVDKGVANIDRATAHGPDVELDLLGELQLARPFKRSVLNAMLRVKIQEAYKQRSGKIATMLQLASSTLKAALAPDGAMQYTASGVIGGRLHTSPAGTRKFAVPK